jgi:hypothetical protein
MEYKKGLIGMLILVNLFLSGYLAYIYTTNDRGFCLTGEGVQFGPRFRVQ